MRYKLSQLLGLDPLFLAARASRPIEAQHRNREGMWEQGSGSSQGVWVMGEEERGHAALEEPSSYLLEQSLKRSREALAVPRACQSVS